MNVPIVNHPDYVAQIGDDHRFPINKFGELIKILKNKNIANDANIFEPSEVSISTLSDVHDEAYINKINHLTLNKEEVRRLGFPLVKSVRRRSFVATGGTVLASKLAVKKKLACNTAGGSHHAFSDQGNGYCVFNDVAVAAKYLKKKYSYKKILILDLDVHQGDGTAKIFENDDSIFTVSVHSKKNYPSKKQISNIDIELDDGIADDEYINVISHVLKKIENQNFSFVFYVAGVDVHYQDRLGKLKISENGIRQREKLVINNFFKKKIPLCGVLGGGYNQSFEKLVNLHSILHETCNDILNN
ncbi:MAG: histone deacetylase [Candidatus Pelagibacter sp.]|nr:histone deacetylase [Candidatus Pelagibacter sp.]OUV86975.1 MAG: histone deacetylase [Pelagibacteraceae bacterium TMED136]|tara:strand:+ start:3479 stop:4384 length:906 start_codon:yes stop_codon:yes gene_type:complete